MKDYIIDERTGITYTLVGDYYLPNIALEFDKELEDFGKKLSSLGKYGIQRYSYLKKNQHRLYMEMLINGTLFDHLKDVDDSADLILKQVTKAYAEADGCDESLKASDEMRWAGLMNNYHHCAEEIINSELICI